ncbi:hypothetical protein RUND412_005993 [Rhizina undulata]
MPLSSAQPHVSTSGDTFSSQRDPKNNTFGAVGEPRRGSDSSDTSEPAIMATTDRRMSKEWDAAKTPPSRFQKVEGSIYATPPSRDGHIARNKIQGYKEKVRELEGRK